jgi:drug/metabolite transporter (DMT)-like permease
LALEESVSLRSTKGIGVAAGVISAAAYGLMSYVVHSYGGKLPSTEIIFFRSIFALLVLGPFAFRDRRALVSKRSNLLWLRSLLGAISILSFTWNLQHTSIGLASVLFNVAPIGVLLIAWISHSERLTVARSVCLVLVVGGGFVFWGDAYGGGARLVFVVGLGGALAAAASYTVLKQAAVGWSPFTLTWGMSLLSIPVTLLMKRGAWVQLSSTVVLPLLSIAILCCVGQVFVALSYRWAELSTATALASSTMAWGVLLDALAGSTTGLKQLIGCVIYLAGCIPLTIMKAHQIREISKQPVPVNLGETSYDLSDPNIPSTGEVG